MQQPQTQRRTSSCSSPAACPVDEAEVYYLVLQFLKDGPCAAVARQLEAAARANGLLPTRHTFDGAQQTAACVLYTMSYMTDIMQQ
jgi:hypothetical protein